MSRKDAKKKMMQVDRSSEGLKPLKILVEIYDHALKDVAIAPTLRSGNRKTPQNPQEALASSQRAVNLRKGLRAQAGH